MRILITIIRMAIGWHFLYEGLAKLFAANWSAMNYLNHTIGFTSFFYHWLASSPLRMQFVDIMNIYGLIGIGVALSVGVCIRWALLGGITLLTLYYFAYPPFGISLLMESGDTVFIVNKIFIEASILVAFLFSREKGSGIDELIRSYRTRRQNGSEITIEKLENGRREAIKNLVSIPVLGALGGGAWWNKRKYETDGTTGATIQVNRADLSDLKGELPKGKLGDFELSRLIMGGNLIGGWAHARDLLYAGSLFKAYNTEKKIFETLMLCE